MNTKEIENTLEEMIVNKNVIMLDKSLYSNKRRYSFSVERKIKNDFSFGEDEINHKILKVFKEKNFWLFHFGEEFIESKTCLKYLREHLESEYNQENLDFFLLCSQYEKIAEVVLRKELSKKIFQTFIKSETINLTSETVTQIEIGLEESRTTLFERAKKEIIFLLNSDCFPRFVYSKSFFKLINKILKDHV